jgi:hypothetical protein
MIDQHTLYVDNFRGFKETYVPISRVNFLVGENSSGKTSILSLLKLLAVERLLLENQFVVEDDIDFGTFDDIVSAHADNRAYFRVGMIRRNTDRAGKTLPLGMLITYQKHEGLPRDHSFTCTYGRRVLALRRIGNEFHFRTRENAIDHTTDIKRLIAEWAEEHDKPPDAFKKLDTESEAKKFKRIIHMIGKDSGLFDAVEIKRFGTDSTSPFEIRIVLDANAKPFNVTNVGYGISRC